MGFTVVKSSTEYRFKNNTKEDKQQFAKSLFSMSCKCKELRFDTETSVKSILAVLHLKAFHSRGPGLCREKANGSVGENNLMNMPV